MKIQVTYFFRKPFRDYFSIEELFGFIQQGFGTEVIYQNYYLSRFSKGLKNRFLSCLEVISKQNQINHITGDIHFVAAFMKKKRTVLTIHDLEVLKRLTGISRQVVKFFWFTMPAWRVKYITVISEFTRQELIRLTSIKPEKIMVVHNCVSPAIQAVPEHFNAAQPTILHIGTAHNKNLERLIEALEGLPVKLIILGNLRDHQKELLVKHHLTYENRFNLAYSEVIQLYQQADIVSFVSLYEGFGMPVIEAQATGRPVITSRVTSIPEIAGDGALLVNPEHTAEIRTGIERLIEDDEFRKELIQKGFKNVERFKPEAIALQYQKIYERMLNEL
jgi:glycosyltransferase involved in cell wall biosynthesis